MTTHRRVPTVRGPWAVWWCAWALAIPIGLVAGVPQMWFVVHLVAFFPPELVGAHINRKRRDGLARTLSEVLQWVSSWTPGSKVLRGWDAVVTMIVVLIAIEVWLCIANWGAPVMLEWRPRRPVEATVGALLVIGLLVPHLLNPAKYR